MPFISASDLIQFDWLNQDDESDTQHGSVDVTTSIEVTGELSPFAKSIMKSRLLCLYTLSRLNGSALAKASEMLVDIYSWQLAQTASAATPKLPPQRQTLANPSIKPRARSPFKIEET